MRGAHRHNVPRVAGKSPFVKAPRQRGGGAGEWGEGGAVSGVFDARRPRHLQSHAHPCQATQS